MEGFCAEVNAAGLDLTRALIATAALDPSIRAQSLTWERDGGSQMASFPHGESSIAWQQGPLVMMIRSGTSMLRRRLGQPLASDDYALFAELKAQGFTDWVAYAHWFHWEAEYIEGGGMGMVSSWATRDPAGFSEAQLDFLRPRVGALAATVKSLVVVDIALHVGHVNYGNIGTARRLDFTVIGQAVNEVARMESLCGQLGEPILISGPLADLAMGRKKRLRSLGSQALRGLDGKMPLYGL